MNKEYENNNMWHYLCGHNYISTNNNNNKQKELSVERAECIANKYRTLTEEKDKEIDRLNNIIDKAIEYIKTKKAIINTDYIRIFDLFGIEEQGYTDVLLNILQGADKE